MDIFQQIDALKKELEGLEPIKPEFQRKLDRKFRLEFNYNSNHLEGNTLTYSETELLLYFDGTKGDHTLREYEEMQAHDVALKLVGEWAKDLERPLSERDIKELNEIILVRPFWKEAITPDGQPTRRQILVGEYKQHPNSVRLGNGELFEYTSPMETPIKMGELIQWFRDEVEKGEMHPVELAARLHHRFVLIHPFDDGNGRISRLLMNYVFWRFGYPPIIIKSSDKQNYLRALNRADVGEMEFFVEYIGKQVMWSLELSVRAAKGESIEEADDVDKELELLRRKLASKEKILNKKADLQAIKEIIENSLVPLFQAIEGKIVILHDFFLSRNRIIQSQTTEGVSNAVWETWDQFQNGLSRVIAFDILRIMQSKEKKQPHLKYLYLLNELNNIIPPPSFSIELNVSFEEYHYSISPKSNEFIEVRLRYGDILTKEQMGQIVTPLVQHLIEQIRQSSAEG